MSFLNKAYMEDPVYKIEAIEKLQSCKNNFL